MRNGDEEGKLYVSKGSHRFVFQYQEALSEIADLLVLEPVVFVLHSVFLDHGYLQQPGADYLGHVNLRYHVNLCLDDLQLQESISYAY